MSDTDEGLPLTGGFVYTIVDRDGEPIGRETIDFRDRDSDSGGSA